MIPAFKKQTIMIKVIWTLIGLNTLALLVSVIAFFIITSGKQVGYMERGWSLILFAAALAVILLAAVPLKFGQSKFSVVFAGFFAALPLVVAGWIFLSKKIGSLKKKETYASIFFSDPSQRAIARAIETGDTLLLKELVKGKDLGVRGTRVWDAEGFNYLQFAVHVRSNPIDFPFNDETSQAGIRVLIANGSPVTPALREATRYLPPQLVEELLKAGADPNLPPGPGNNPLLFDNIGQDKVRNDIAILLVRYGADINARNYNDYTPIMYAAEVADASTRWYDGWRVVRYILENKKPDYRYVSRDGQSFPSIVRARQKQEQDRGIVHSPDFKAVIRFLDVHVPPLSNAGGKK